MKHKKHKLTNEAYKLIKELVLQLPPMQRADKNTGKLMFRQVSIFKGIVSRNGKKFKEFQNGWEPVLVNHQVELIKRFESEGYQGIEIYRTYILALEAEAKAKEAEKPVKQVEEITNENKTEECIPSQQ